MVVGAGISARFGQRDATARDPRRYHTGSCASTTCRDTLMLLELDGAAGFLDLALDLLGLLALDALLDGLGGLVHERLRLLEAEARDPPDGLDHLDLLVAGGGQHHVDRARLLAGAVALGRRRGGGRGGGYRRGGDAELLLERLDALGELEHRDALELLDPLLRGHLRCHVLAPRSWFPDQASAAAPGSSGAGSPSASPAASSGSGSAASPVPASGAGSSGSVAASGASGAPPPTSPRSEIWESWRPSPEIMLASPLTRPVSGLAASPTSWPCSTSRPGSRAIARKPSGSSGAPSMKPPL